MTLENLKTTVAKRKTVEITEGNYISSCDGKLVSNNLNLTRINSLLVKQAAKHCESYASDIVIDINAMEREIRELAESVIKGEDVAPVTETVVFGFRNMGVDGKTFVGCRLEDPAMYGAFNQVYKAIYFAEITVDEPKGYYPVYVDVKVHFYGLELAQEGGEKDA